MPTYIYHCRSCKKNFEKAMSYSEFDTKKVFCPRCGGKEVYRKIGRVRFARSEESRLESIADPSNLEGLEDDPRAMGKMMRKMSREMGEDMGPEFDEVIDRLESGQNPEEIEQAIPGLGGEGEGAGAGYPGGGFDDY